MRRSLLIASALIIGSAARAEYVAYLGADAGLCGNLDVPCGFELAEEDGMIVDPSKRAKITVPKGPVTAILDEACRRFPRYKWTKVNGVINILPVDAQEHKEAGKSPLTRKIDRIELLNLPTNQAATEILAASGLPVAPRQLAGIRQIYGTVTLRLHDVTLQEALNELVKADGKASWNLEYYPPAKKYIVDIHSQRMGPSLWRTNEPITK